MVISTNAYIYIYASERKIEALGFAVKIAMIHVRSRVFMKRAVLRAECNGRDNVTGCQKVIYGYGLLIFDARQPQNCEP